MEPLLAARHLTKSFGGVRAVDDVSLDLAATEMRAIIGPNGCGKTTLFNVITGYHEPDEGTLAFAGEDLRGLSLHAIARAGLVRKFQVPSVFGGLAVRENLQVAFSAPVHDRQPVGLMSLLDLVGLSEEAEQPAGLLSHGQKQWLELAMVLATSPRLVLLDEPAAGMTHKEREHTVALLKRLRATTGLSIMLIEHDMDFVEALDCPVSVMMLGRIVAEGSFAEVKREPAVRQAYLGTANA